MFAIAAFAVIERSYCLVLDDYAKLLFTPSYVFIRFSAAMRADSYKRYTCYNYPKELGHINYIYIYIYVRVRPR